MCTQAQPDGPSPPPAIGPTAGPSTPGGFLICSGQITLDPESGQPVGNTVPEQTRRGLENLAAVCAAASTSLASAVRPTVYMTALGEFAAVNDAYPEFFESDATAACAR